MKNFSASLQRSKKTEAQTSPILVTGGAGYVGQKIVEMLCNQKREVIALYRNRVPDSRNNLFPICADLAAKELLVAPIRGVRCVIHLAWDGAIVSSDLERTRNVKNIKNLIQVMEHAGTKRIIFVSAIGADREAELPFLREKYECEHLILNSKIKEKIIIRSAVLFDGVKGGSFIQSIKKVMRSSLFYPVPKIQGKISPLYVDDLIEVLTKSCDIEMFDSCSVIDLAGGESYKISQLLKIISKNTVGKKSQIALNPLVGDFMVKLIERRNTEEQPKIKDYFSIGSRVESKIRHKNPMAKFLPEKFKTFEEVLNSFSLSDGVHP